MDTPADLKFASIIFTTLKMDCSSKRSGFSHPIIPHFTPDPKSGP